MLERVSLTEAADRQLKTYSGGMRRRIDLGAGLVAHPRVLLLDEPTTGLDPANRIDLWAYLRDLVEEGASILLTTQYLEEADQLASQIVVIDHGRVIESGTPLELKRRLAGDLLDVTVADGDGVGARRARARGCGRRPANVRSRDEPIVVAGARRVRTPSSRRCDDSTTPVCGSSTWPSVDRRSTTCSSRSRGTPRRSTAMSTRPRRSADDE